MACGACGVCQIIATRVHSEGAYPVMKNGFRVCRVDDLNDGQSLRVETQRDGAADIAVHRVGNKFYATDDRCTHEEWSLGDDGELEGHEIAFQPKWCSWSWTFWPHGTWWRGKNLLMVTTPSCGANKNGSMKPGVRWPRSRVSGVVRSGRTPWRCVPAIPTYATTTSHRHPPERLHPPGYLPVPVTGRSRPRPGIACAGDL
jgi:nitrite reductase/ring-hydroxylating ferredoxin subunit